MHKHVRPGGIGLVGLVLAEPSFEMGNSEITIIVTRKQKHPNRRSCKDFHTHELSLATPINCFGAKRNMASAYTNPTAIEVLEGDRGQQDIGIIHRGNLPRCIITGSCNTKNK